MVVKWRICNVGVNSSIPNELQPHLENPNDNIGFLIFNISLKPISNNI